jgi:hypothetical protein
VVTVGGLRRVFPGEQARDGPDEEDYGPEFHVPRAGRFRPCPRDGLVHSSDSPHNHNRQGAACNLNVPLYTDQRLRRFR